MTENTYFQLWVSVRCFEGSEGNKVMVRVTGDVVTNRSELLRALCLADRGVFMGPSFVVAKDVAAGALVQLLLDGPPACSGATAINRVPAATYSPTRGERAPTVRKVQFRLARSAWDSACSRAVARTTTRRSAEDKAASSRAG